MQTKILTHEAHHNTDVMFARAEGIYAQTHDTLSVTCKYVHEMM